MPNSDALTGLRYHGAKNANTPSGIGLWVAERLPTDAVLYCEPFAGMLGMLLQRPKAEHEAVNDLDARLMNWWTAVRDEGEELQRLIALTPSAQRAYEWAQTAVDDDALSVPKRALAYTILVLQSYGGSGQPLVKRGYFPGAASMSNSDWRHGIVEKIPRLAERLSNVMLLCEDACVTMERYADMPEALLYCDPPYGDTTGYKVDVDRLRMAAILGQAKARVALSGYADEWDHLGWRKEQRASANRIGINLSTRHADRSRVESIWTNYDPPQASFDFGEQES